MKVVLTIVIFFGVMTSFAQDVMIMRSGKEENVRVEEVGSESIKYKKMDNLDGPTYVVPKADVFMIKYANGAKDVFNVQANMSNQPIVMYDKKSPVLAWFFSFLLAGGGQYYNGDYGKGALMTGVEVASLIGMVVSAANMYPYDSYSYYGNRTTSMGAEAAMLAFTAIYFANSLWSMIDAPVRAGEINRSRGLMSWDVGKKANLSLCPDLQLTSTFGQNTTFAPSYGAKLTLKVR